MDESEIDFTSLQEKFRRLYEHPNFARSGGFFRTKKREQLIGLFGQSGRDRTKYDFWYDVREAVKTALIDLQLFIETANDDDVNAVINRESLYALLNVLLHQSYPVEHNGTKSKLAQLFIETGFSYLRHVNREFLVDLQHRAIDDAIQLSKQLTLLTLSEDERKDYRIGVPRI